MQATEHEVRAMRRALTIAATPGLPLGPNPRVGCVLLGSDGEVVAEGYHRGAGTEHAEVDALIRAGSAGRGATAVVTLEPCNHTGRTGPCARALIEADVRRVVVAQPDPNPIARGGADTLAAAGVEVVSGVMEAEARALNRAWTFGVENGRPLVTWKLAASLDGRSAAADGTSRWVSGPAARADTHRLRAQADVILAGTGTVEIDDPRLSVRDEHGELVPHQPLRAVMGLRDLDPTRRVLDAEAETHLLRTRDPHTALAELFELGRRHVFLEGGPTLAAAFLRSGVVGEVVAYISPVMLGAGLSAVGDLGIDTIADSLRLDLVDVAVLGDPGGQRDVRITAAPLCRSG